MKAFRMAAYWPLLKWNSARRVGASTDTTWRSMKLMVVSPNSSAIRMKRAPRVKTGSNFGAAGVLDMGSQYHRCAALRAIDVGQVNNVGNLPQWQPSSA